MLAQLLWLCSIWVIACKVNKHDCNFPKSAADTFALVHEWGYSGTMKSRVSTELWIAESSICGIQYYVMHCEAWFCSHTDTHFCCLASLDFLCFVLVFFFISVIPSIFINLCIPVLWLSGAQRVCGSFFASLTPRNNSFLSIWIKFQFWSSSDWLE